MRGGKLFICILLVVCQFLNAAILPSRVAAAGSTGLVISHVIVGETSSSSSEMVAIYNNSISDIDVTGYCIKSNSATTSTNPTGQIACIQADINTKVFIKSHSYLTITSALFATTHVYTPDTTYPTGNKLLVGGDTLSLVTGTTVIDSVTWGAAGLNAATNGTLQRKETSPGSGTMVDSDTPADFTSVATLSYPANTSYDVVTLVDVCPNIDGVQTTMPVGFLADENGNCQADSCLNLPGLQISVPDHFDADATGSCTQHDECDNVDGIQTDIPEHMTRSTANDCAWDIPLLVLSEILPNAIGSDTGNEFIEVYNPTNDTIDLSLYSVQVGADAAKTYAFPVGATIVPGEYRSFSDSAMKFTLVNTTGRVVLAAIDGSTLGDTGRYDSPAEGESWAYINGQWQYTNQSTPGAPNQVSIADDVTTDGTDTGPAPCPAGKYRNPLTGRCRTIESDASILAACDADQYRSPDTGRCRKITTANLAPCKDNQYRSEETNRCRTISLASVQKPCKDNQYRSEETNRCRNLPVTSVPEAAFAVQPVKDSPQTFVGWWALGAVGALVVGYAGWEWRREVLSFIRHMLRR